MSVMEWWKPVDPHAPLPYLARMQREVRIAQRDQLRPDKDYWALRTPEERLAAIEFLRTQYMAHTHAEQRLQRVCRIAQRARR